MTNVADHTGHIRMADGSVIRIDVEAGSYVARYYRPDMSVRAIVTRSLASAHPAMRRWTRGFAK